MKVEIYLQFSSLRKFIVSLIALPGECNYLHNELVEAQPAVINAQYHSRTTHSIE